MCVQLRLYIARGCSSSYRARARANWERARQRERQHERYSERERERGNENEEALQREISFDREGGSNKRERGAG